MPASRRVPGLRDRRGRARDRAPGARVARAAAAAHGARRQRDLRGDVFGGDRRHPPLFDLAPAGRLPRPGPARVYQSGRAPAKGGRISKQGSPAARWALVEAAWSAVQQPGPLRAFYQRIRGRRGSKIAVVAAARKLAALFWSLLSRGQDYAHAQPSLTAKKLRLLEIRAGAPTLKGKQTGTWATRQQMRTAERELARQAEASYKRTVRDWQATTPAKAKAAGPPTVGASVTPGRA